jgi:hypothetical protein
MQRLDPVCACAKSSFFFLLLSYSRYSMVVDGKGNIECDVCENGIKRKPKQYRHSFPYIAARLPRWQLMSSRGGLYGICDACFKGLSGSPASFDPHSKQGIGRPSLCPLPLSPAV